MALQCNVSVQGGITHTNAYIRAKTVMVFKDSGVWKGLVEWEAYKDSIEASSATRRRIPTPGIDRNEFAIDINGANPFAQAYVWAKANKPEFAGAADV